MNMRTIWLAVAALGIAGCASTSKDVDVAAAGVTVAATAPARAKVLGPVEASHCRRNGHESSSAEETALQLLKSKAAAMGANGVANVAYETESVSLLSNCWSSAKARGIAFVQ
jgi:uncharacterized protein YbjQ (UPF0145 family)